MNAVDYSKYTTSKLRYVLDATRKQISKFEDAIIKADKQINDLSKKRAEYLQKEALICKELNLKLPIPNAETRKALENDEIIGKFSSHEDFEKSLNDENI